MGSLVAFSLLAVSGAGLIHYTSNVRKTSQSTVEQLQYKPILKAKIINGMKSLLMEKNIDENGKIPTVDNKVNTYGICSLVKPPEDFYGIEQVDLNLFNIQDNSSWDENRWSYFFSKSEWEILSRSAAIEKCKKIDSSFLHNGLSRCLMYRGETGLESAVIYAIAQIIPKTFPQFNSIDTGQQSGSLIDSKKVIFYLRTQLMKTDSMDTELTAYKSSSSDIVWANEVGECNVMAGGKRTIVKFSGTGPGTTFDRNVFNSPSFSHNHSQDLEILNINADIVQAGSVEDFDLFSLSGLNTKVSCVKNKFKCKQDVLTDSSNYDDFRFTFNVINYKPHSIPIKAINVTLKKEDSEFDGTDDEVLNSGSLFLYHSSNESKQIEGNKSNITFDVPRGSSSFEVKTAIAPVCQKICEDYDPSQESSYVYPVINIHENKNNGMIFEKDYSNDVSNRVRCTVCHMKACHRYGLGTFGPYKTETSIVATHNQQGNYKTQEIYGLTDEPLDAQVPECLVKHQYDSMRELPPAAVARKGTLSSSATNAACKGITIKNMNNISAFKNFKHSEYEAIDCDTELPVLCFVNGHYYPAMKLTGNTSQPLQFVTAPFKDAQKICFEMGREKGNYYDLAILLFNTYQPNDNGNSAQKTISAVRSLPGDDTSGFTLEKPSSLKFDFINNVSRGLFLAPPTSLELSILPTGIEEVIKAFISSTIAKNTGYKLWTAMEWDAGGAVIASPPWGLVAKEHPFSFYFSKGTGHSPILLEDTTNNFSEQKYMALSHNIRWKGLVPQTASKKLPFVCQRKDTKKFFITANAYIGKADEGVSKCDLFGGHFVPPESSIDWVKVMLKLNRNDSQYPYPDPGVSDSDMLTNSFLHQKKVKNLMAWVALKHVSGTNEKEAPLVKDLRLSRDWPTGSLFLKSNREKARKAVGKVGRYMSIKGKIGSFALPDISTIKQTIHCSSVLGTTQKSCSVSHNLISEDYYQLCVQDNLPFSLKGLNEVCPSGTTAVDLKSGTGTFEPVGIQYMVKYWDNIASKSHYKDKKIILYDVEGTKQKIKDINDKITELKNSCTSSSLSCPLPHPLNSSPPNPYGAPRPPNPFTPPP